MMICCTPAVPSKNEWVAVAADPICCERKLKIEKKMYLLHQFLTFYERSYQPTPVYGILWKERRKIMNMEMFYVAVPKLYLHSDTLYSM